jgi:hypothetical protein
LADVPSAALRQAEVPRLSELRLAAAEARVEAELRLGRHAGIIGELRTLVAAEPLRERLAELLMLALYRSGQQAAALGVYRAARRALVEQVGIEPGPGLREMNQKILLSDPALELAARPAPAPARRHGRAATNAVRPSLLPSAVPDFTGRAAELAALSAAPGQPGRPVVITAIGGTAGVGKTALAVHWARQAAPQFPDGQFYVNLHGFGPAEPLHPSEALRAFLDAWQVPPAQIPANLDGRYALYRSLLRGKKILILLDNARDPAQVRPLLPGTADAQVLITSPNELAGLAVPEARRLLRELARGQLLTEPAPGRFSFHDLLRAYAAEQAETTETAAVGREAVGRALDYYLHTAHAAAVLLYPGKAPLLLGPPRRGACRSGWTATGERGCGWTPSTRCCWP